MKPHPIIFWVLVLALIAYEVYAILTPASGDTISETIWNLSHLSPMIAFFFGVLMGHFFWQRGQ